LGELETRPRNCRPYNMLPFLERFSWILIPIITHRYRLGVDRHYTRFARFTKRAQTHLCLHQNYPDQTLAHQHHPPEPHPPDLYLHGNYVHQCVTGTWSRKAALAGLMVHENEMSSFQTRTTGIVRLKQLS
jgi:hypothetical protein